MIGLKSYWLQPFITYSRTRLAAELLLHGKFGFRETRLSRGATVLQLAQDENIWTPHVCSLILLIAIYVHVYLHILWLKQGSHLIQIYNLQIFLSDLIDSINLYRKRCSIERRLAISFFSPFIITKQGQWYLEAWSHFFFNYMTNDSKQIPVHRIITMCNLISYMFIVLKRGIRTCRCLTTARKI